MTTAGAPPAGGLSDRTWARPLAAVSVVAIIVASALEPMLAVLIVLVALLVAIVALSRGDAVTLVSLVIVFTFGVPARYIFGPLGAAGTPATILSLGCLWWWIASRSDRSSISGARGRQPFRLGALILVVAFLPSYAVAFTRPAGALESNAADRTMIIVFSLVGLGLLIADGVRDLPQLLRLLRFIVAGASVMAVVAILQFVWTLDITPSLALPWLEDNSVDLNLIRERSMFNRVAGTALHPIELGVILATVFPLALHFAFHDRHRPDWLRWLPVVLLGFAIPMSISRSAILAMAVALVLMVPIWDRPRRHGVGLGMVAGAFAMTLLVGGLLGTIRSYFINAGEDPSIQARTDDYDVIAAYFFERPIFGRGVGTFIPTEYIYVDNQFLLTLTEAGLVGLLGLVTFLLISMSLARGARHRSEREDVRHLGQALFAGIAANAVTFLTFDALSFRQNATTLFLLAGSAGALWRMTHVEGAVSRPRRPPSRVSSLR